MNTTTYGMHLTLRVSNVERPSALNGSREITDLLKTIVHRIGMRILAGPLVGEEEGDNDHKGWSGVVILYESHAAIHTYPDRREAFIDIFSCLQFDPMLVNETLSDFFGSFDIMEENLFHRGIHWGVDVKNEMREWVQSR